MVKVYVCGAYSSPDVIGAFRNVGRGQYYAGILFKEGFAPFCPFLDFQFVIQLWDLDFSVEEFYKYSMEWLKVSDCLFVVPNVQGMKDWQDSHGTRAEIAEAEKLGIPVFYELEDLFNRYDK